MEHCLGDMWTGAKMSVSCEVASITDKGASPQHSPSPGKGVGGGLHCSFRNVHCTLLCYPKQNFCHGKEQLHVIHLFSSNPPNRSKQFLPIWSQPDLDKMFFSWWQLYLFECCFIREKTWQVGKDGERVPNEFSQPWVFRTKSESCDTFKINKIWFWV